MALQKHIKLIIIVLFLAIPIIGNATNLRGRIDGFNQNYNSSYPLVGVAVELYFQGLTGWQSVGRYITGADGMYYFRNIIPGYYSIQINGRQNYPVTVLKAPHQDLPPIMITY
ncbi:MAG: hypothetical protein KAI39_06260 [Desulfobulbaceae bacterium]|nr:hypothetical protein [Desulfobulbaceae bacterium]